MHHNRQRISLHDLTALRIDVNGERAKRAKARSRKQASSAGLDARGNMVTVRPFARPHKHKLESGDERMEPLEGMNHDYPRNKKKQRRNNYHPELLPFLHPPSGTQSSATGTGADALPSSDLLKVIHHFASCYYDERGMLTGSATTAKRERLSKAKQTRDNTPSNQVRLEDTEEDWEEYGDDRVREERLAIGQIPSPRKSPRTSSQPAKRPAKTGRIKPHDVTCTPENRIKDMHRAFDGSALLLVGMILQSHIESRVTRPPPLPSEWEEQVRKDKDRIQPRSLGGRKRARLIPEPVVEEGVRDASSDGGRDVSETDSEDLATKADTASTEDGDEEQVEYSAFNDINVDSEKDQSI